MPLQLRRGTDLQRQNMQEPLATGELIYITDTGELYIGDGTNVGGIPIAQYTTATIKSLSAGVLTGGAHSGISFVYDSVSGTIDAVVDPDLSNYQGVIRASAFNGSLVADDSTELVDAVDGKINLDGTVHGDIIPNADQAYDIGSAANKFKDIYLSGSSIFLGDATITASGTAINLPAGSTVNGTLIGSGTGSIGDGVIEGSTYKINIAADDSSIMIDSDAETVTAAGGLFGDLVGNVTGNLSGLVTGNLLGDVIGDVTGDVIGELRGDSIGYHTGDVNGNVVGEDSTILVDSISNKIRGDYDNGSLTIVDGAIISVAPVPTGFPSARPVYIGSDTEPNTLWISSDQNFSIYKGLTDGNFTSGIESKISRGTVETPLSLLAGDGTLLISGDGYNGTDYVPTGILGMFVDPDWNGTLGTSGEIPGSFGAIVLDITGGLQLLSFNSRGVLNAPIIKTTGYATVGLPSNPEEGFMVFDSTTKEFKGWNGTAWVVLG